MTLRVIVPPTSLPVSLRDLRAQARADGVEDELGEGDLSTYLQANVRRYGGPHGVLRSALITQTLEATFDAFPPGRGALRLACPPLQAVASVKYVDADGVTQTLDPDVYVVAGLGDLKGGELRLAQGQDWPEIAAQPEAVIVQYRAGYGDTPADVPLEIRQAYAESVAHWKTLRQNGSPNPKTADLPDSAKTKLDKHKATE